jgi:hypothetical protein
VSCINVIFRRVVILIICSLEQEPTTTVTCVKRGEVMSSAEAREKAEALFFKAREMSKNRLAASRIRMRYLCDEIEFWVADDSEIGDYYARLCYDEIHYLLSHASYTITTRSREKAGFTPVTQDQIEAAKRYPVERLIHFERGKAKAFCHNDNKPSMYLSSKKKLAACPVCGLYFNAVDVLVHRDGYKFYDAVRQLAA